jgi:hypothetical protein
MDLIEIWCEGVTGNTVMNLQVLQMTGNFLTSRVDYQLLKKDSASCSLVQKIFCLLLLRKCLVRNRRGR